MTHIHFSFYQSIETTGMRLQKSAHAAKGRSHAWVLYGGIVDKSRLRKHAAAAMTIRWQGCKPLQLSASNVWLSGMTSNAIPGE